MGSKIQVSINGKQVCVAGGDKTSSIYAFFHTISHTSSLEDLKNFEFNFGINGSNGVDGNSVNWCEQGLNKGDKIELKIIDINNKSIEVTEGKITSPPSNEQKLIKLKKSLSNIQSRINEVESSIAGS